MRERPILFSGEMVRAILAGTKTQTRRMVKPQPQDGFMPAVGRYNRNKVDRRTGEQFPDFVERYGAFDEDQDVPSPFEPGMRLWVKETFAKNEVQPLCDRPKGDYIYRADLSPVDGLVRWSARWTPSIHMPRRASRLTLEIIGVRCERLQDISEADAQAEGVRPSFTLGTYQITGDKYTVEVVEGYAFGIPKAGDDWQGIKVEHVLHRPPRLIYTAKQTYAQLWDRINGPGSWDMNPWVWVVEFRQVEGGAT